MFGNVFYRGFEFFIACIRESILIVASKMYKGVGGRVCMTQMI